MDFLLLITQVLIVHDVSNIWILCANQQQQSVENQACANDTEILEFLNLDKGYNKHRLPENQVLVRYAEFYQENCDILLFCLKICTNTLVFIF